MNEIHLVFGEINHVTTQTNSMTKTSLFEDSFFRTYGQSKSGGDENQSGYHYDDYEDYTDED